MKCPICKNYALVASEIEGNLSSRQCPQCSGRWIGSFQYWKWHDASGKSLVDPSPVALTGDGQPKDTMGAKLCPECGHFLRRYPVGHGVEFGLDRCGNCGGIWFDRNEWETLKRFQLHTNVHKIFSEIWQRQLQDGEHQAAMESFYREKFGPDDYQQALKIKSWLDNNPNKTALLAFLKL